MHSAISSRHYVAENSTSTRALVIPGARADTPDLEPVAPRTAHEVGRPARVLMVINRITPLGGTEGSTLLIIDGLHDNGCDFSAVVLHGTDAYTRDVLSAREVPLTTSDPGFRAQLACVCDAIRSDRPDLIHAALFDAELVACLAGAIYGVPVVRSLVTAQYGNEAVRVSVSPMRLRAVRLFDRALSRFATFRFHAVSQAAADAATRAIGIPSARITVVPRGRDPRALGPVTRARRDRTRQALGLDPEAPMLFNAARLVPQKGQLYLVEAFARVLRTNPAAVLVIAGLEGSSTPEVRASIDRLGLREHVRLLGVRDDVADLLCAADVFVFSSLWEGLPGAVLEAMAMSVPVVAFGADSVAEAVGDTGVLVPIGDVAGLADALDTLLHDSSQRAELARRGRKRFEEQFTIEVALDGMREFYLSAVADARTQYRDRFAWLRRFPGLSRRFGRHLRGPAGP